MDHSSSPPSAPLRTATGTPLQSTYPIGVEATPAAIGGTLGQSEFAVDGDVTLPHDGTRYLQEDVSTTSTNSRRRGRDEIDDTNQRQNSPHRSSDRSNERQPPQEHVPVDYNTWQPTLDGETPFEHSQRTRRSETELHEAADQRAEYNEYLRQQETDSTTLAIQIQPVIHSSHYIHNTQRLIPYDYRQIV